MEVYTAKDLTFTYKGEQTPVLQNVSFSVPENAFVLLYGASGSGKTTLLRLLKSELAPKGTCKGELLYNEKPLSALPYETSVREIAFTAQNPDTQQVSDYVKTELAFLPENLGLPQAEIELKIAETVGFFGISDLYTRQIQTLSGGEKQLVNLAAACVGAACIALGRAVCHARRRRDRTPFARHGAFTYGVGGNNSRNRTQYTTTFTLSDTSADA